MQEAHGVIIVGIWAIAYGLFCLYRILRFRKWNTVEGTIVSAAKSYRSENFQKFEDAAIVYEYEVNGKTYRSSTIKAAGEMSSDSKKGRRSEVDRVLARYPLGKTVAVRYNPAVPRISCLEVGGAEAMFICLVFGPIAVIVGYFLLD
jgi:hypothetical protein